ncbi:hypothetical protein AB1Y20_008615 [Prymnesium parvum]|uniref:Uncharacterized protein n=1 Tax=Prymnesium parvum TaxID=97485 RepID=A0AB34ISX6_PRYPA
MLIRRRAYGVASESGVPPEDGCAWTALRRLYEVRVREVPPHLHGVAPLFSTPHESVRTADVLEFIREAAAASGEDPAVFNARALRPGVQIRDANHTGRDVCPEQMHQQPLFHAAPASTQLWGLQAPAQLQQPPHSP